MHANIQVQVLVKFGCGSSRCKIKGLSSLNLLNRVLVQVAHLHSRCLVIYWKLTVAGWAVINHIVQHILYKSIIIKPTSHKFPIKSNQLPIHPLSKTMSANNVIQVFLSQDAGAVASSFLNMMQKEPSLSFNYLQSKSANIAITETDRTKIVDWCYSVIDCCQFNRETVAIVSECFALWFDMLDTFLSQWVSILLGAGNATSWPLPRQAKQQRLSQKPSYLSASRISCIVHSH